MALKMRLLIAEDNPQMRWLLRDLLAALTEADVLIGGMVEGEDSA